MLLVAAKVLWDVLLQPTTFHSTLQVDRGSPEQERGSPLEFPTFEPFGASLAHMGLDDPARGDLKALSEQLLSWSRAKKAGMAAAQEEAEARFGVAIPQQCSAPSALRGIEGDERAVCPLIPVVLMRLERCWRNPRWTPTQVEDARAAVIALRPIPDLPKVEFAQGEDEENQKALEELVRWYRAKVAMPDWYAAMMSTSLIGPYVGIPYEAALPLCGQSTQTLDDQIELRLCRVEHRDEPWILQAVSDGRPLWSRVVSAAAADSVWGVSFMEDPVQRLGPYGWKVNIFVQWSAGSGASEVYLNAKGDLLFYFLRW